MSNMRMVNIIATKLSQEFKDNHSEIPWRAIRGMRNVVAHEYGKIDVQTVWETAESGAAELMAFCQRELDNDISFDIQLQGF